MKKHSFKFFVVTSLLALGVSSCGTIAPHGGDSGGGDSQQTVEDKQREIYQLAVSSGYSGTYEEWLNSIRGAAGTSLHLGTGEPSWQLGNTGDTYLDSSTWTLYVKGANGWQRVGSIMGQDGKPGKDGLTPYIGENGNWFIGSTDTGVKAQGTQGNPGETPRIGENGNWWIGNVDTGVKAQGPQGQSGKDGVSIVSVAKTSSKGLVDTYTITYSDGHTSTFEVTNGKDGASGEGGSVDIKIVNGHWWVDGVDTGVSAVAQNGIGIKEVTSSQGDSGTVVTIITDDDKPHSFIIPNGKDGKDGKDGRGIVDFRSEEVEGGTKVTFIYSDKTESSFIVPNGKDGKDGAAGTPGTPGGQGEAGRGIEKIETEEVSGGIKIIVHYTDETTSDFFIPFTGGGSTPVSEVYLVDMSSRQEYNDYGELITINTYYYSDGSSREEVVARPRTVTSAYINTLSHFYDPENHTFFPEMKAVVYYQSEKTPVEVTLNESNIIGGLDDFDPTSTSAQTYKLRFNNFVFSYDLNLYSLEYPSRIDGGYVLEKNEFTLTEIENMRYSYYDDMRLYNVPLYNLYYYSTGETFKESYGNTGLMHLFSQIDGEGEYAVEYYSYNGDPYRYLDTITVIDDSDTVIRRIEFADGYRPTIDIASVGIDVLITYGSGRTERVFINSEDIYYEGNLGEYCYVGINYNGKTYWMPYYGDSGKHEQFRVIDSSSDRVSYEQFYAQNHLFYSVENLLNFIDNFEIRKYIVYENGRSCEGERVYTKEDCIGLEEILADKVYLENGYIELYVDDNGEEALVAILNLYDYASEEIRNVYANSNMFISQENYSNGVFDFVGGDITVYYQDKNRNTRVERLSSWNEVEIVGTSEYSSYVYFTFSYRGYNFDSRVYFFDGYRISDLRKISFSVPAGYITSIEEVKQYAKSYVGDLYVDFYYQGRENRSTSFSIDQLDLGDIYQEVFEASSVAGVYNMPVPFDYHGIQGTFEIELTVFDDQQIEYSVGYVPTFIANEEGRAIQSRSLVLTTVYSYYANGELIKTEKGNNVYVYDVGDHITNLEDIDFTTPGQYNAHLYIEEGVEFDIVIQVSKNVIQYVDGLSTVMSISSLDSLYQKLVDRTVYVYMLDGSYHQRRITQDMIELPDNFSIDVPGYYQAYINFPEGKYSFMIEVEFTLNPDTAYLADQSHASNIPTDLTLYFDRGYIYYTSPDGYSDYFKLIQFVDDLYMYESAFYRIEFDDEEKIAYIYDAEVDLTEYESHKYQLVFDENVPLSGEFSVIIYEGCLAEAFSGGVSNGFVACRIEGDRVYLETGYPDPYIYTIEGDTIKVSYPSGSGESSGGSGGQVEKTPAQEIAEIVAAKFGMSAYEYEEFKGVWGFYNLYPLSEEYTIQTICYHVDEILDENVFALEGDAWNVDESGNQVAYYYNDAGVVCQIIVYEDVVYVKDGEIVEEGTEGAVRYEVVAIEFYAFQE